MFGECEQRSNGTVFIERELVQDLGCKGHHFPLPPLACLRFSAGDAAYVAPSVGGEPCAFRLSLH